VFTKTKGILQVKNCTAPPQQQPIGHIPERSDKRSSISVPRGDAEALPDGHACTPSRSLLRQLGIDRNNAGSHFTLLKRA
jgi:hypothetical protein